MTLPPLKSSFLSVALTFLVLPPRAASADAGLRAGAARVDITPPKDASWPMSGYGSRKGGHQGIHDEIYVRALVFDDGVAQAAIVVCELSGISNPFWAKMSGEIARATGIRADHVLLAATHTHGGPALSYTDDDMDETDRRIQRAVETYAADLEKKIVEAVRLAQRGLQPARVGAGTGTAYININRRARTAQGDYWLGQNPEGPSDKTVAVVRIDNAAGESIALFINYGVHGTVMGPLNNQITGDLPGATSRFVERHFGDKVVALWTSGTAGDQNPIYSTGARPGAGNEANEDFDNVAVLGQILGEEVLKVAPTIRTSGTGRVRALQKVVTCPGKKPSNGSRAGHLAYRFADGDPVDLRLSLLMVGPIALAGVSGEVLTPIGLRLKKETSLTSTIMVTLCNGSSGYIPDDDSYRQLSYEISVSRFKPGCAEDAIVNTFLGLMDEAASVEDGGALRAGPAR